MSSLFVALDFEDQEKARVLIDQLRGLPVIYKVGLELFVAEGPQLVKKLKASGERVFLDLKLHDIPNTVSKTVSRICDLGVDYFTVHLAGGAKMLEAAVQAVEFSKTSACVLGVSVLTSFDQNSWGDTLRAMGTSPVDCSSSVRALSALAAKVKIGGLVCSPHEVKDVTSHYPSLFTVVPGIRLHEASGTERDDQARIMTPARAQALGAKGIVVGRPITQAANPRAMAEKILKELQ